MTNIKEFIKKKNYLVCIDSDGCAVDSMTIKHQKAFGPAFVETFELNEYKDEILSQWDKINLYSMTRGINRFKGLQLILHYCNDNYKKIDELEEYDTFISEAKAYSNDSLISYMSNHNAKILESALKWSLLTNKMIKDIPTDQIVSFKSVLKNLKSMHESADIVVVSSANFEAINSEWQRLGLLEYVDCICSQKDGSKRDCISSLLQKGYEKDNVIMIGDGPGDHDAAKDNGVHFYPILCKYEDKSWESILSYFNRFINNDYQTSENKLIKEFYSNLE